MSGTKFRRLPNGYGCIIHMKNKKLRKPYAARRRCGSDPKGHPVYKTVGTFETYAQAFDALMTANRIDLPPEAGITFGELYSRFREEVLLLPANGRDLSASSLDGYGYAFRAVPALHRRPFTEITAPELQNALANAGGSASKQIKIRLLYSRLYKYADYLGITDRNLAQFVRIVARDDPKRNPFTRAEVRAIWEMPRSRWRDCALVMLYTGMRVGELFTVHDIRGEYFRAGLKTDAGINRIVPIHPEIAEIVRDLFPLEGEPNLVQHWFRRNIPGHTPHDCRRTFVTVADECGMNPTACRQIVGHSTGDVHTAKYTLHPAEFLCSEMKKLRYDAF